MPIHQVRPRKGDKVTVLNEQGDRLKGVATGEETVDAEMFYLDVRQVNGTYVGKREAVNPYDDEQICFVEDIIEHQQGTRK